MTKFERISWIIWPLAASWLAFAMIVTSIETRARQKAYWAEEQRKFLENPPMVDFVWKVPEEPPKEGDVIMVDWAHLSDHPLEAGKTYIILDPSKVDEDWEIVVGQSAHEFVVFREKGEVICTIGVIDGALILDGKESKAVEFIKKYFELRK